jgi:hypothetical protein
MGEAVIFGHLVDLLRDGDASKDMGTQTRLYCLMFFTLVLVALVI